LAYWKEVNRLYPNDKEKAEQKFKSFIKRSKVHFDGLHYIKGSYSVTMKGLSEDDLLDIELFKLKSGGKSKKSPNQMSGKKGRNILCDYENTIIPCLTQKGKLIEDQIKSLLDTLCCIQFLCYSNYEVLSQPKWRIQTHLYAFVLRDSYKIVFKEKVNKVITLHTHGITFHLPSYTEEVIKDKRTPIQNSIEFSESQFAKQNKINTNKHQDTLAVNWIETARRDLFLNQAFKRKRDGKNNSKVHEWTKNRNWEPIVLENDGETKALLGTLKKFGYENGEQNEFWKVDVNENTITFVPPPFHDLVNL